MSEPSSYSKSFCDANLFDRSERTAVIRTFLCATAEIVREYKLEKTSQTAARFFFIVLVSGFKKKKKKKKLFSPYVRKNWRQDEVKFVNNNRSKKNIEIHFPVNVLNWRKKKWNKKKKILSMPSFLLFYFRLSTFSINRWSATCTHLVPKLMDCKMHYIAEDGLGRKRNLRRLNKGRLEIHWISF